MELQSEKKNVGTLSAVVGQMYPRSPKSMLVGVMSSAATLMDATLNGGNREGIDEGWSLLSFEIETLTFRSTIFYTRVK